MVKLYVEGGGDSNELKSRCREGFREFVTKAGVKNRPRIIACGSRNNAFEDYCTAIENGEDAMLLVDSEAPVRATNVGKPWDHLKDRDGWQPPAQAADADCHLMVQVMESWFVADRETLKKCTQKGVYGKGAHSFQILKEIDPTTVQSASPRAKRFIDELKIR